MQVLVTGATGFIGSRLVEMLLAEGHGVRAATRDPARARLDPRVELVRWTPREGVELGGTDAVVHLAGAPVAGKRWTASYKEKILASRLEPTRALVAAMGRAEPRPRVLVSSSAVGYYGSRGDETLDEASSPGSDFLAGVCREWEEAALAARAHGVRVVCLRTGVVLGPGGGALAKMLPAFKAFAGGPVASGQQWTSWVERDDLCRLILWALGNEAVEGPINATAPEPVRNRDFSAALGRALGRPSWLPVPALALRALFGEGASVLLDSQRVLPVRAQQLGFEFRHKEIDSALRASVG